MEFLSRPKVESSLQIPFEESEVLGIREVPECGNGATLEIKLGWFHDWEIVCSLGRKIEDQEDLGERKSKAEGSSKNIGMY